MITLRNVPPTALFNKGIHRHRRTARSTSPATVKSMILLGVRMNEPSVFAEINLKFVFFRYYPRRLLFARWSICRRPKLCSQCRTASALHVRSSLCSSRARPDSTSNLFLSLRTVRRVRSLILVHVHGNSSRLMRFHQQEQTRPNTKKN